MQDSPIYVISNHDEYRKINQQVRNTPGQEAQALVICEHLTRGQLNAYMLAKFGISVQGPRDTIVTEKTQVILDGLKNYQVALALTMAKDVLTSNIITPFNVADVLLGRGYSMEYFNSEDAVEVQLRGKNFKKSIKEGVLFTSPNSDAIALPVINSFIDTGYLPEQPKTTIPKFNMVIALSVQLTASYTFISNNAVKAVNFSPDANTLTGMNKIVKPGGMTAAAALLENYISERKAKNEIKTPTSLSGAKFAHEAYSCLMDAIELDSSLESYWITQFNLCLVSPMITTTKSKGVNVHSVKYKPVELPLFLNEQQFGIEKQSITIPQAYDANKIARSVRGENDSEKAVFSRTANYPFTVPYRVGEACTVKADYQRYYSLFDQLFIDADKTVPQTVISDLLDALTMSEYKGQVLLPVHASRIIGMVAHHGSNNIKSGFVDMSQLDYRYRSSTMQITLYPFEKVEYFRKSFKDDTLVIDLKVIAYTEGQYNNTCTNVNYLANQRMLFHDTYLYKYVFVLPLVDGIEEWARTGKLKQKKNALVQEFEIRSGYQMTNLHAFYSNFQRNVKLDSWSYDLTDAKEVTTYCSAAALMTILRCIYKFTGVRPNRYLEFYKFKTLPISVKGMAKIGANILLTMKLAPGQFEDVSIDELRAIFDTADVDQRIEIVSANPSFFRRLQANPDDIVVTKGKSKRMLGVEDDTYVQEGEEEKLELVNRPEEQV
jgi:hypothetical protein